jgi:hypothetical protein
LDVTTRVDRRTLLRGAVVASLAAVVPITLSGNRAVAQVESFEAPVDLLTFALQLKYFQAEFYRQGDAADLLDGIEADWLSLIGRHKQAQVAALTDAVNSAGARPPVAPALIFGDDVFPDRQRYLDRAATVEETVVQAYVSLPLPGEFPDADVYTELSGMFSVDARAAAVLASLAGWSVRDGVYRGGGYESGLEALETLEVLRPYVAGPWEIADQAGITS